MTKGEASDLIEEALESKKSSNIHTAQIVNLGSKRATLKDKIFVFLAKIISAILLLFGGIVILSVLLMSLTGDQTAESGFFFALFPIIIAMVSVYYGFIH